MELPKIALYFPEAINGSSLKVFARKGTVGGVELVVVFLHDISSLRRNSAFQKVVPTNLCLCDICAFDFCAQQRRGNGWTLVAYFGNFTMRSRMVSHTGSGTCNFWRD